MSDRPDVKCPKCGDVLLKFLQNSTLCEYCYQAETHGGTAQDWKNAKARYLKECADIQAKIDAGSWKP